MTTVSNNPGGEGDGSGSGFILGVVVVILLIVLFGVYGFPFLKGDKAPEPQKNDDNTINVEVQLPTNGTTTN